MDQQPAHDSLHLPFFGFSQPQQPYFLCSSPLSCRKMAEQQQDHLDRRQYFPGSYESQHTVSDDAVMVLYDSRKGVLKCSDNCRGHMGK